MKCPAEHGEHYCWRDSGHAGKHACCVCLREWE